MSGFKMQMSVEVSDRQDLLAVLSWVIDHLTQEKWDEYVSASPHSSTLYQPGEECRCHGTHKSKPVGKLFVAPAGALMFQSPRQTGEMSGEAE
jgi:hypothetical protein